MFKDKSLWLDSIFATLFVFLLMFGVQQLFVSVDVLDPIGDAVGDVEVTDVVFSQLRTQDPIPEERVVLVNIGDLNRAGIAEQIRILNKYNPKVIGIDARFFKHKSPELDSSLAEAFSRVENMVLASKLEGYDSLTDGFGNVAKPIEPFLPYVKPGFANFIATAENQDQFKVVRTFSPSDEVKGEKHMALAVMMAHLYDSAKTERFLARGNDVEVINFIGNALASNSYGNAKFPALDVEDVFSENFVPELIEGKIVLMGYMGGYLGDPSWDDKFFTPLNTQYAGRTNPDMFGVIVHANIIAMILNENYIDTMSDLAEIITAFILGWINIFFFILIYRNLGRWYDGLTKVIQLVEAILILVLMGVVFNTFDYKLNLGIGIAAVAFAGDSLEIYFGVVKNLFSAEGRKELFNINR